MNLVKFHGICCIECPLKHDRKFAGLKVIYFSLHFFGILRLRCRQPLKVCLCWSNVIAEECVHGLVASQLIASKYFIFVEPKPMPRYNLLAVGGDEWWGVEACDAEGWHWARGWPGLVDCIIAESVLRAGLKDNWAGGWGLFNGGGGKGGHRCVLSEAEG